MFGYKWHAFWEHFNPYYILTGIKNLWRWKGVIWNDRQYDQLFLFKTLKKKIDLMIDEFEQVNYYVGAEKDIKNMRICSLLLDRIIKDEYGENVFKNHDRKWGEIQLSVEEEDDDFSKLNVYREGANTPELKEKEGKQFSRLIRQEEHLKRQDINYLFTLLKKYIRNWWW